MLFGGVQLWGIQFFSRKVEIALSMRCHAQTPEVEVVISLIGRAPTLWQGPSDAFPIPERCDLFLPNSWALISKTPLPRCWVAKTLVCEQIQRFWLRTSKKKTNAIRKRSNRLRIRKQKAQGLTTFLALLSNGKKKQETETAFGIGNKTLKSFQLHMMKRVWNWMNARSANTPTTTCKTQNQEPCQSRFWQSRRGAFAVQPLMGTKAKTQTQKPPNTLEYLVDLQTSRNQSLVWNYGTVGRNDGPNS